MRLWAQRPRFSSKSSSLVASKDGRCLKALSAHGTFEVSSDRVVFTETYTFDDGHSDTPRWTIHKMAEGQYIGTKIGLRGKHPVRPA